MTEKPDRKKARPEGATPAERPTGDREVNPADGPGPRGNQEPDPGRVDRDREDYERAGAN